MGRRIFSARRWNTILPETRRRSTRYVLHCSRLVVCTHYEHVCSVHDFFGRLFGLFTFCPVPFTYYTKCKIKKTFLLYRWWFSLVSGISNRDLYRELVVGRSTQSAIWESKYHNVFEKDVISNKRITSSQRQKVEQALPEWFRIQQSKKIFQ